MKQNQRPMKGTQPSSAPVLMRQLQRRSFGEQEKDTAGRAGLARAGFELGNIPIMSPRDSSGAPVQAKLTVGAPNDRYEQEADSIAARVVEQINVPQPLQREEMFKEEELQMKPQTSGLQREEMPEEEELQMKPMLQRRGNERGETSAAFESMLDGAKGGGQALPERLQRSMGQAMGADFSGVQVHHDARSDQLSRSVSARAFTTGQDVFFRQGEYQPRSRKGQELLAHELTHVVQQNGDVVQRNRLSSQQANKGLTTPTASISSLEADRVTQQKTKSPTIQRFTDNLSVTYELNQATLPVGDMYSFINMKVQKLRQLCTQYRNFEDGALAEAQYMRDAQAQPIYNNAVLWLESIIGQSNSLLSMLGDQAYDSVRDLVINIRNCARADEQQYRLKSHATAASATDAYARIFKQGSYYNPYAQNPQDYITENNFKLAEERGLLQLHMHHWWRTRNYPGFNAEIHVFIGGRFWAIAHIKWNAGHPPSQATQAPFMYNFKTPNNDSFDAQYSHIHDDSVQIRLLGACLPYFQTTNTPWRWRKNESTRNP